jgi:hypothetical protein
MVSLIMNELNLTMKHRTRDNVGGVVIGGEPMEFRYDPIIGDLFNLMLKVSCLSYSVTDTVSDIDLKSRPTNYVRLRSIFTEWIKPGDQARGYRHVKHLEVDNCRILARIKNSAKGAN